MFQLSPELAARIAALYEKSAALREVAASLDAPSSEWLEWRGMPEYTHQDLEPYQTITVHFAIATDLHNFERLIKQPITPRTRSLWFPHRENSTPKLKRYVCTDTVEKEMRAGLEGRPSTAHRCDAT